MNNTGSIIEQTKKWIRDVVIGCNFCPFAAREVKKDSIHYQVEFGTSPADILDAFLNECKRLDEDRAIETTLLILPNAVPLFADYLKLLSRADSLLKKKKYEGIYQLASFHPLYLFEGSDESDAANYTNRSTYPMLHLLREESVERVLKSYPEPEAIPERNMRFAREWGVEYMRKLMS